MTPPPPLPNVPLPTTYKLFNVEVPVDAPITGTFSYDTTATGTNGPNNAQVFTQFIQGGLSFDVLRPDRTSLLHLVASQSSIMVNNDFLPKDTPSPIDSFEVDLIPPPAPFLANGASIASKKAIVTIPFNWDEGTFTGIGQPYLWPILPPISYATVGVIGTTPTLSVPNSLGSFELCTLAQIQPKPGDYNVDRQFDVNDYAEWRKAFGDTDAPHLYADGNTNGVVDDADYVVWRNALSLSGTSTALVPEPSLISLAIVASVSIASFGRRRA
jgi:hypothetical protein